MVGVALPVEACDGGVCSVLLGVIGFLSTVFFGSCLVYGADDFCELGALRRVVAYVRLTTLWIGVVYYCASG